MILPMHADAPALSIKPPSRPAPRLANEHAVVERIAEGDERAFELLFTTYYKTLCDFAFSYVGSKETAEDLVQTTLFKVWYLRRTWQPHKGVSACLFASCRNVAIDYLRHHQVAERVRATALETGDVPALGRAPAAPDDGAHARELTDAIRGAVAELPERRRAVVVLRWQYQLGPTEIAGVMGITVKSVETHFARAVADLRESLKHFR